MRTPQELLLARLPYSVHYRFWRAAIKSPAWAGNTPARMQKPRDLIDQCVNDNGMHCLRSVSNLMRFCNQQGMAGNVLREISRVAYSHAPGSLTRRGMLVTALTNGNLTERELHVGRRWLRKLDASRTTGACMQQNF